MLNLLAAALMMPPPPAPQTVFACHARHKRITITLVGDRLDYSFGLPGRRELGLSGGPGGGVFYHRESFARGEDQTLRFIGGPWSYLVFNRYEAPPPNQQMRRRTIPEHNVSGLLVMKGGAIVRRIDCDKDSGDLHEWAIFPRLKQDKQDLTPDDA
jgi:hypothetical protein